MFRVFGKKRQQNVPKMDWKEGSVEKKQPIEDNVSIDETRNVEAAEQTFGVSPDPETVLSLQPDDAETEILLEEDADIPTFLVSRAQSIGQRPKQEDALCHSDWRDLQELKTRGLLAAVADGIGGLKNGEIASATVVRTMYNGFMQQDCSTRGSDRLLELAALAQKKVLELNLQEGGMGSTLVSVLIQNWHLWMLAVGDSRVYLYRSGGLIQLNRPHIYGKECEETQALTGACLPATGRKAAALYAFIGQDGLKSIDRTIQPLRLMHGDRVLLLSDGVFTTLSEDNLTNILMGASDDLAGEIIAQVEKVGKRGQDNATALVIGVE